MTAAPVIDLLADLILRKAVSLLNLALELIATAINDVEIIICEFSPLFLDLSFGLLPIPLHLIPVHMILLLTSARCGR